MKNKVLHQATTLLLIASLTTNSFSQCVPPTMNAVSNQSLCNGSTTTAVNFSGTGSVYNWTNNTPSIGLPDNGIGNIASFTAINNGSSPVTATITVTPESTSSGGSAYISNNSGNSVSVINTTTNVVTATVSVGGGPTGISVSSDGSRVYISNTSDNSVSVINTATNTVIATIGVGNNPYALSVTPDGSKVYVANYYDNSVSVINTATDSVIATIAVASYPNGTEVSPDGSTVYVANIASNTISVINTATNTVTATIAVGHSPNGVAVSPDGSKVYVADRDDQAVAVINAATNSVTTTITVGINPNGIAISPDGSRVYTANLNTNNVSVINTATNTVTATIAVGNYPVGISVSPDGSLVYVANYSSNTASAINTTTNTVIATIGVGSGPFSNGNFITGTGICYGTPATFNITVNATPPAPGITQMHNDTLFCTTNAGYLYYQWYLDSAIVPGATDSFLVISKSGNYNVEVIGVNGCKISAGISVVLGLRNYMNDGIVSLTPNPTGNELTIKNAELKIESICIYNMLGQQVQVGQQETRNSNQETINVSMLSPGIYFIQLKSESGSVVKKFIKE